jgi:hypothetical protein
MKRKIEITESQFKRLMKTITEVVSGYDDFHVMHSHGEKSLVTLIQTLQDLEVVFFAIKSILKLKTVDYENLKDHFRQVVGFISEISKIMKIVFKDLPDRKLAVKGDILLRGLESYLEKLSTIFSFRQEDLFNTSGELNNRLLKLTMSLKDKIEDYTLELNNVFEKYRDIINKDWSDETQNMN